MSEDCHESTVAEVKRSVRLDDKMKLRELELVTQYELKYLSDSFSDLKSFVKDKLNSEHNRFDILNKKVNWLTIIILAQLGGINADLIIGLLSKLVVL